mmetsp:Transcript_22958/g.74109  ORF Transcript_22958/g.74109 Transcript_22958/m.74109 type:complete len:330 (+) Transcript_22958:127-1116(+)
MSPHGPVFGSCMGCFSGLVALTAKSIDSHKAASVGPSSAQDPRQPSTQTSADQESALLQVAVVLGDRRLTFVLPPTEKGSYDTGLRLWTGGLLLAGFLAEQGTHLVQGRAVLELGAGVSSLPAAMAAQLGASLCIATDYSFEIVAAAQANLDRNGSKARAEVLDWEFPIKSSAGKARGAWDVVMFADAICTEEAGTLLASCIDAVVDSHRGLVVGSLSEIRVGTTEFMGKMQARGFVAEELHLAPSSKLKASIDECSLLVLERCDAQAADNLIHGRPVAGSKLVCWRRRQGGDGHAQHDESDRLRKYFAEELAHKEINIRLSDGFEIWE